MLRTNQKMNHLKKRNDCELVRSKLKILKYEKCVMCIFKTSALSLLLLQTAPITVRHRNIELFFGTFADFLSHDECSFAIWHCGAARDEPITFA